MHHLNTLEITCCRSAQKEPAHNSWEIFIQLVKSTRAPHQPFTNPRVRFSISEPVALPHSPWKRHVGLAKEFDSAAEKITIKRLTFKQICISSIKSGLTRTAEPYYASTVCLILWLGKILGCQAPKFLKIWSLIHGLFQNVKGFALLTLAAWNYIRPRSKTFSYKI